MRRYTKELRFNDAPWLAAPEGVRLAHPKLSQITAEAVGVRSLRLALLAESSEVGPASDMCLVSISCIIVTKALTARCRAFTSLLFQLKRLHVCRIM